jgi:ATP-dependent Clp protease, proteolytic subunit ClpP|nr:MAG TPA: Putative ATP dependent Clp protease [Caudoviricetes sp.]
MAVLKIRSDIQTQDEKELLELWGMTGGVTYNDIADFCDNIPEDDNTIDVYLHCNGGSVIEGWGMYDRLRATGKEITCIVEGKAASMATILLMAAPKERRKAYKNASLCVHNPWLPNWALDYAVTADDLEKAAKELRESQDKMLDLYVERCGCDREEMQALMNEDKYIDTDKAMEMGLIGSVIAPISASKIDNNFINKKQKKMAEDKSKKVEVKASIVDRVLAKLGIKSLSELECGMDLSTTDGQTLTIEREEGDPQVGDKASPDGTHNMPDGKTIIVKDGVITEITDGGTSSPDPKGGMEDAQRIAELEGEVEELKKRIEELEQAKAQALANAKTADDLRILNAVKIAGGEKALAKISSGYVPPRREPSGKNASEKGDKDDWATVMEAKKAAIRDKYKRKGTN